MMQTKSPTILIDELAYLLDMSAEDVMAKRHAWVRYKGFPKPIKLHRNNNNVYVRAQVEAWIASQADGQTPSIPTANDADEARHGNVLDELKAYAAGAS
jgi:predicted DNA-binding transcriptional regulator AlpA